MLFREYLIFNTLNCSLRLKNPVKLILVYSIESRNIPFGPKYEYHIYGFGCGRIVSDYYFELYSVFKAERHSP